MGLKLSEEDQGLPYLYWTPTLHKTPFKHGFIAGSSKCTTKELSFLLTKILTTIKKGLSKYCNTTNEPDSMWILKNSTSLSSSVEKLDVRYAKSVQAFDFSSLYTSIPHDLLKSRISILIRNSFEKKDGGIRYTYIKVDGRRGYFSKEFLIDNIFVKFGGHLPMGTNCAPLLADLFFYSYESDFFDNIIRSKPQETFQIILSMFPIYR